ncbi:MAG: hypothetical protein QNJ87_14165 [Gammaproteobacteria bacterium]|nr:hypothetical protein [Gammaproteobacteria bacterium]
MLSDTLFAFAAAVALLVLISFLLTSLVVFSQHLFERRLRGTIRRPEFIPFYSRSAVVVTIALLVAIVLLAWASLSGPVHLVSRSLSDFA